MKRNDEALTDYLDGRCTPAEKAAFEARLSVEPALARRLRVLIAMRKALRETAPRMPEGLRAALKARIRARTRRPSWRERLLAALTAPAGCGLCAALAAGALLLAIRLASSPRASSPAAGRASEATARLAGVSADLWSDDDGRDRED